MNFVYLTDAVVGILTILKKERMGRLIMFAMIRKLGVLESVQS